MRAPARPQRCGRPGAVSRGAFKGAHDTYLPRDIERSQASRFEFLLAPDKERRMVDALVARGAHRKLEEVERDDPGQTIWAALRITTIPGSRQCLGWRARGDHLPASGAKSPFRPGAARRRPAGRPRTIVSPSMSNILVKYRDRIGRFVIAAESVRSQANSTCRHAGGGGLFLLRRTRNPRYALRLQGAQERRADEGAHRTRVLPCSRAPQVRRRAQSDTFASRPRGRSARFTPSRSRSAARAPKRAVRRGRQGADRS